MKNSNDKKWTIKDLLVEYTTNQAKKQMAMQQKQMLQEELKQKLLEAQSQNLSQYVPGARQPAPEEMDFEGYAKQGGIYIDPSKRGTFKAQATRMGMSVQEAARHILSNKNKYSPAMVKKANFARNFAKEEGGEMASCPPGMMWNGIECVPVPMEVLNFSKQVRTPSNLEQKSMSDYNLQNPFNQSEQATMQQLQIDRSNLPIHEINHASMQKTENEIRDMIQKLQLQQYLQKKKDEGGEMMIGDDDDRKWWQFWKKDKPMTYEDKVKAEIANIEKYIAREKETLDAYYRFAKDQPYNPYTKAIDVTKSNLANLEKMKADAEIKIKDATAEQKANFDKQRDKFEKQANQKAYGGQMIKRADGSYSQRGLWDNIRANKGSGKAPTKEMLAQERKIKRKKYNEGGTLPSCEEGYYWNPDTQSCQPITNYSNLNEDQKFLIKMANSPLFEERYNKMIGKKELQIPMQQTEYGPEQMPAENFRKNIIENVSTVKYAPKGEGDFDPEHYKGAILPAAYYETHIQQLDSINNVLNNPKYNKKQFKDSLDELQELKKRLENKNHTIFTSEKEDRPYTNTHETSHASTLGKLFSVNPYKAEYRNPFKESGKKYLQDAEELKTSRNQEIYESLIKTYENIGNKMLNYKGYKNYYDNPVMQEYLSRLTEIKARKDAALKHMMDKGLYDPINNRFTEKDYDNLLRLQDQDDIKDLIHNYPKEDIIRMFNEIVANNPKSEPVAKRGGQLGRFLL